LDAVQSSAPHAGTLEDAVNELRRRGRGPIASGLTWSSAERFTLVSGTLCFSDSSASTFLWKKKNGPLEVVRRGMTRLAMLGQPCEEVAFKLRDPGGLGP